MAKRPGRDDSGDIKKLIDGLYKIVQTTNATSKEQVRINRELLKTMAVLQAGFAKNETDARQLIDDVRDGLELNDDYAKKWLKKMGATERQIEDIIDQFRDLEKIDSDLIDNADDYLVLLNKRYDVLDDTLDLTKRLLTNQDAITRAIRSSKDVAMKLVGPMGDVDGILRKMVDRKVDIESMFDNINTDRIQNTVEQINDDISGLISNVGGSIVDLQLHFSPLTDDLDKEIADVLKSVDVEKRARIDGLMQYFDINKKLQNQVARSLAAQMSGIDVTFDVDTGEISTATGILKKGTDEYQAMIQQLDDIAEKNNITGKLKEDFGEIANLIALGTDRTVEQSEALTRLLGPLDLASKMLIEQIEQQNLLDKQALNDLMIAKERYKLMGTYLNQLQTAESIVLKIGSAFDNLNAIMPTGIGEFLGLSKVSSQLIEAHRKGVQAFTDQLEKGASHADALRSYYKELSPSLSAALSPMTILVTSTVLLFNFVSNIVDKYKQLNEHLHTSLGQSKKLYETELDILTSQKNQFATMDDIVNLHAAMIANGGKVFDLTNDASKQLAISLIDVGKAFGYGTEKAVELHRIFNRLGADDTLARSLQENLGLLSEAAGISPQIITDDLIDSADEVATYFAGLPEQAAKAAIQVRQLGMSLKQAGSIAKKMLNLESFMTDMYELQAMTSGGVDFSKAFDLGLAGDMVGMTKEIMNNIGTVAEFDRMDYLTRIKIANTLGMSVDELARSVKLHEDMQGLSEKDQIYLQNNLDRMGDISSASKDEIRNRLQQLQATDRLAVAWDKIKGVLVKSLLPAVELIADAIDAISPLIDLIVIGMKAFGSIIKIILPIIQGMLFPLKVIGSVLDKMTSAADSFLGTLKVSDGILGGIKMVLTAIGGVLGTIFLVRNVGTFFSAISSGFLSILKSAGSIVPAIKSILGSVFESITGIPSKVASTVMTTAKSMTDSTAVSIDTTKEAAKTAINEIQSVTAKASDAVKTVASSASSANLGKSMADSAKSGASEAIQEIDKVQKKTKEGFFKSDKSKTMFKAIGTIGAATIASLGTKWASSFFKAEKDGEESMGNLADMSTTLFGTSFALLGPLLSDSLSYGVEKFFRKKLEGKLEKAFEGPLKKIRKGFGTLEQPAVKALKQTGKIGSGVFGKMLDKVKKLAPKSFGAIGGVLSKITSKFTSGKGLISDILGDPDQITDAVSGMENVANPPIEQTVIEHKQDILETARQPEKSMEPSMEKVKPPKESIEPPTIDGGKSKKSISKTFESIGDAVKTTWESIKSAVKDIIQFGIDSLKQIAGGVVDVAKILIGGFKDISGTLFSTLKDISLKVFDILKSASKTLKSVLTDIVDFVATAMKQLSSGIGQSIKNILKGIGDGLSSFKSSALRGAAALVVLSGALWVASKAIRNFAKTKWQDVAKAGVVLGGLVVAGLALGSASPAMLLGAAALAGLAGGLLISAVALEKFNAVDWSSLGKAAVALLGLGAIATVLAALSPAIAIAAAALAVGSVSIMLFAGSISMLSESMKSIDPKPVADLSDTISSLLMIPTTGLFQLSAALAAVGASMLAFSAMRLGSSVTSAISGMFANDMLTDLEKLASMANPLQIASEAIKSLSTSLADLSATLNSVDLSKIDDMSKVGKISVEQRMYEQIQGQLRDVESRPRESQPEVKIVPVQMPAPKVQPPRRESVAQDVRIVDNKQMAVSEQGVRNVVATPLPSASSQGQQKNNTQYSDIYNRPELSLKDITFLLQNAVKYLEVIAKKNTSVNLDSYKVNKQMKAVNNK